MSCKTTTEIRVRYGETDQMGYVYYGNYALYLEQGRTDWLRKMGFSYKELEAQNILLPVTQFSINSVGTVSEALSTIAVSVENSVITTPRLKPRPSTSDSASDALNVTAPVPWSTLKNLPTLKIPFWSVET